jgi:hypothetical protein
VRACMRKRHAWALVRPPMSGTGNKIPSLWDWEFPRVGDMQVWFKDGDVRSMVLSWVRWVRHELSWLIGCTGCRRL